jgi:polyisoprenoid-binding protein YceI
MSIALQNLVRPETCEKFELAENTTLCKHPFVGYSRHFPGCADPFLLSQREKEITVGTEQASQAAVSTWNLDSAHTAAEFKVKHMMISNVKGQFSGVTGTLSLDEQDVTNSQLAVTIPTSTINTGEPDRDTHLKSADFFDVEKFPTISFKSTSVIRRPDDELEVVGDLTIHGVTRQVRLAVEGPTAAGKDPWGNTRIGASAITKINRKDFGLVWNAALETGGMLVGEDVAISIDAEFIKA